jgi:hypothetical protein
VEKERTTQARRRSSLVTTLVAVLATVATVVAVMTVPRLFSASGQPGPTVPRPPAPTRSPDAPGTRTWQALRCPPAPASCAAPLTIDHAGLRFDRTHAWHRVVGTRSATTTMTLTVPASPGDRWILVGVEASGPGSRPAVWIGRRHPVTIPTGRLTLFPLPDKGRLRISVSDVARPRRGEVLRVAEYVYGQG